MGLNTFSNFSTSRAPVIERSRMSNSDVRVCSSIIEAILTALRSMVESTWLRFADWAVSHQPDAGRAVRRRVAAGVSP